MTPETTGIRCRFLAETRDGALVQCSRTTPNQHTELCVDHIKQVLRSVRDAAGKRGTSELLEALR